MSAKIVVVGSFNADLVVYMQRLPGPGETVSGDRFITGPGGKGSNQAVAAARLGADVTFIGRVGQDRFAEIGLELWREAGVDTTHVGRDPEAATGIASIYVDRSGENTIALALGANLQLSRADIDAAAEVIAGADVLLTQLEVDHEVVRHALQTAHDAGVQTILNPAPAAPLPAELFPIIDYLTPNETELRTLAGPEGSTADAAARLLAKGTQTMIVTLGRKGAQWYRQDGTGRAPAFAVEAVDAVGAGDAFNAGLAVALAEGKALHKALLFANAVAAVSVTRHGAAASMPSRQDVDTFLQQSQHES